VSQKQTERNEVSTTTNEQIAGVNGVELCFQPFGDRSDQPILLSHGGGNTMLSWAEDFCERLAAGRRFVVRYDSRDSGRSTTYEPGAPKYALRDLVADAAALIDVLGLERAHFVGLSQGAGVGQLLAIEHPEKVATLTLLSSTPGIPGGSTDLPGMAPELAAVFSDQGPEPDWNDRDAAIEYIVEAERPFAGPGTFDEDAMRRLAARVVDRATNLAANLTNPFVIEAGENWRPRLNEITAPTLVIHGEADPMFPLEHGRALAREIPGAKLVVLERAGHEYPPPRTWDVVIPAILRHTEGARQLR
jgi:pimeloyl-ACP methyl ester carboxylesterase